MSPEWLLFACSSLRNLYFIVPKIRLFELDPEMNSSRKDDISFIFEGLCAVHDFLITENWYIFMFSSAKLNTKKTLKALIGLGAFAGTFDFNEEKSHIYMIPRADLLKEGTASEINLATDSRIKDIPIDKCFSFHLSNAFENPDGNVVFEVC